MDTHHFLNLYFLEHVLLTYGKLMILQNFSKQFQECEFKDFPMNKYTICASKCNVFSCFFKVGLRDRFFIWFFKENGPPTASKIDPWGDLFGQKGDLGWVVFPGRCFLQSAFFWASFFRSFWVPFRSPFGQCWGLLAPFWEHFGRSWLNFARNK